MKPQTKKISTIFLLVFICFNAFVLSQFLTKSIHTLSRDHNWLSMKRLSTNCCWPMGTMGFIEQRQVFAGNQLNLSEWHGFNELILNQNLPIKDIHFNVKFEQGSYVWIFFLQDHEARYGIRLSQNQLIPSGFFKLNYSGKILTREEMVLTFFQESWESVSIKVLSDQIQITAGGMYYQFKKPDSLSTILSFKTGISRALIDDVVVLNQAGQAIFQDSFSPKPNLRISIFSLGITFLVTFLLGLGIYFKQRAFSWENLIPLVAFQVSGLLILLSLSLFDFYVWSHRYYIDLAPMEKRVSHPRENLIETWRRNSIGYLETNFFAKKDVLKIEPVISKLYVRTVRKKPPFRDDEIFWYSKDQPVKIIYRPFVKFDMKRPQKLIAFMGTSQTWGEGANTLDSAFLAQTVRKLNLQSGREVAGINFSLQGKVSQNLLAEYKRILEVIKPDLLMVNLGWNDGASEDFKKSLIEIAELSQSLNIKTIFSHEAITNEVPTYYAVNNHSIMTSVGKTYSIPILKFYEYMSSNVNKDSGLLWWDVIHMNQHGHDLASEFFSEQLGRLIND